MKYKKKKIKSKTRIYKDQYFDKLNEWQEHQYDPGHYTGGNIPPILTNPGRPAALGWLFIVSAIIFSTLILIIIFKSFDKERIIAISVIIVIVVGFGAIQLIVGVRLIRKGRELNKDSELNKKKIILAVSIVFISTLFILSIYMFNNHYEQISITSMEQVNLKQLDGNNYVYIKKIDKTLICSYDDYGTLWSFDISYSLNQKDTAFKIEYVCNNFNPGKGKVIKIIS